MVDIKENNEQSQAFKVYYKFGVDRSYAKIALQFKKSLSTIEKWGRTYNWQERVEDLEKEVKRKTHEKAIVEQELDYKQRNLRVLKRIILEGAKGLQDGTLKITPKILLEAMREEERMRTGIDTTVQINHRFELRGMSNIDIQEMIDNKVKNILGFKELKHFKEISDPIVDAEYKEVKEKEDV